MTMLDAIGLAAIIVLLIIDYMFFRLISRTLAWAVNRLPQYRPGGRYRSQSTPEKYAPLGKPRNGS